MKNLSESTNAAHHGHLWREPTLRQLACFKEVAHHHSFSRAAASLSMSQPALSSAVRELETAVGASLLDRRSHFVRLTSAGEAIISQVKWMLSNYQLGVQDLRQMLQCQADTLRIAYAPSVAHLIAPWIACWQQENPLALLHWSDMSDETLGIAVEKGEIDIGLGLDFPASAALQTQLVAEDKVMAIMLASHGLAQEDALRWPQLRHQSLVMLSHGNGQQMLEHTLAQHDLDMAQVRLVTHAESLYAMVGTGLFVGLISDLYAESYLAKGFCAATMQLPTLSQNVRLMIRKCPPGMLRPAVQNCWDYLCSQMGTEDGAASARAAND